MQFQSESGNQIVDYYEVKDWRNKVSNLTRLKVVTYKGKTVENEAINVFDMAEEIDILLDMNFAVTCNTTTNYVRTLSTTTNHAHIKYNN